MPAKIKLENPCETSVLIEKAKRTKAEWKQLERQEAKNNLVRTVKDLYTQGYSKKAITRELGLSGNNSDRLHFLTKLNNVVGCWLWVVRKVQK
jgi:hypothetical protein